MKVFISENDMPQSCSCDCMCYDQEFNCCNIQDDNGNYARPKTRKDCPHLNSLEKHDREVKQRIAKEILTYVGNLYDDCDQRFRLKDYQWHKNLCEKYGIKIDE